MPTRDYMVVHTRHDHSFRVPRPDLSVTIGTPNACTQCHRDRSDRWAADAASKWWGDRSAKEPPYGEIIRAGREGSVGAGTALAALAADSARPAIRRATAASLFGQNAFSGSRDALASPRGPRSARALQEPSSRRERSSPRSAWPWSHLSSAIPSSRFASTRLAPSLRCQRSRCVRRSVPTRGRARRVRTLSRDRHRPRRGAPGPRRARDRPRRSPACRAGVSDRRGARARAGRDIRRTSPICTAVRGKRVKPRRPFAAACRRCPGDAGLHHSLGLSLVRQKRMPEALVELERAARLPRCARATPTSGRSPSTPSGRPGSRDRGAGNRGAEARRESRNPGSAGIVLRKGRPPRGRRPSTQETAGPDGPVAEFTAMIELRHACGVSSWRRRSPPRSMSMPRSPAVPKKPWNELSISWIDLQLHITAMDGRRVLRPGRRERRAGRVPSPTERAVSARSLRGRWAAPRALPVELPGRGRVRRRRSAQRSARLDALGAQRHDSGREALLGHRRQPVRRRRDGAALQQLRPRLHGAFDDVVGLDHVAPHRSARPGLGGRPAGELVGGLVQRLAHEGSVFFGERGHFQRPGRRPPRRLGGGRRLLHLGVWGVYAEAQEGSAQSRSRPEVYEAPFFVDTGPFPSLHLRVVGVELGAVEGPVTLAAEYTLSRRGLPPSGRSAFPGYYVQASWALTGETRPYDHWCGCFRGAPAVRSLSSVTRRYGRRSRSGRR